MQVTLIILTASQRNQRHESRREIVERRGFSRSRTRVGGGEMDENDQNILETYMKPH